MKKYLVIVSAFLLFAFSSCSKNAGNPVTKIFDIEGTYTQLEVHDAFDVTVSDAVTQIEVRAGENVMPYIVVEKIGDKLKIYLSKPIAFTGYTDMNVTLPYNADLTSVDLSGASIFRSEYTLEGQDVKVELSGASEFYDHIDAVEADVDLSGASSFKGDIKASDVDMDLSGGSDIEGDVEAHTLSVDLSGASNAKLTGLVSKLQMDLSGNCDIKKTVVNNRYGLVCDECEGEMSGLSSVYIHCDGTIKVDLSGSSALHFTGTAYTGDCTTSGSSNIIPHDNP